MVGQAGITGVAGASDLVGNMVSDGFIEGFRNTDIDSIRKATQLGAVGRSAYMNRKYSKAAGKYIKMEGETPQKTVVTVGDKKITVDGEHLKKYTSNWERIKGTAKQSIKENNKKTFLTDLKTKVSKQDQKVIDDILKQEGKLGKIEFEFTKSSGGNPVLARDPESLNYKDRQEYNIAKKIYEQGKTRYGQFNMKHDKTRLYQVLKNLNLPKKQQGGILKFQNSGIIPSINKGLSLPEWLKSPIKVTYNSLKDSNADKLRFTSPIVSKGMSDFATKFPTISKIFNSSGQSYQGSQTVQGTPGELLIDDYKILPYEAKPYRNINPLLEAAKFAFVNKKNQENLALQLKAATQIPKLNTAERTHLRTSNVYSNIADRQANEVSGEGRRLAGTIADIDKALNVRLEGAKQAAGIRATGAYKDIENNQAIRDKQMGIDANTNAYNRNVMDKQSALSAEAMKNVYAIQSMGKTMEANAGQNFLLAYGRNKESEPYRRAM